MVQWLTALALIRAATSVASSVYGQAATARRPLAHREGVGRLQRPGAKAAEVPVTRVVLFSSGVGYFRTQRFRHRNGHHRFALRNRANQRRTQIPHRL